jgi:hypothetical protein
MATTEYNRTTEYNVSLSSMGVGEHSEPSL